ncbi:MAG: CoA transferase, partial [Bacillota bacterium]|nr:CoA transferase [Bacillota bacterium]
MNKPLEGIKILELTHVIAAPFCGMLLGDLGADIIKVEKPKEGEYGRIAGPYAPDGTSLWYPNYNRNKKGITLNFKDPKGKEILEKLIKETDVFIENFRPGLLDSMNLGYKDVKKINPDIIMVSLSGYGQEGPYANKTAFDMTILAIGGLMGLSGETDGVPMKMGTAIADFVAGLYGVIGTLSALTFKEKTGKGQYVDVSMLDGILSTLETSIAEYDLLKREPKRPGNGRVYTGPSDVFKASDGYIYIAAFFENHWNKFCKLIDREDLLNDERFKDGLSRKNNDKFLKPIISEWVENKTIDEIELLLENVGVPCAPVNNMERLMKDEHIKKTKSI